VRENDKWPSPKLANKFGYSEDAAGRPTGPLAARLTRANVSIFLLRGRVTLRDLRLSPQLLDGAVMDAFLPWAPFRTRALSVREVSVRLGLVAPRLRLSLDGFHIRVYGRWLDTATMVEGMRCSRTGLFRWVDQVC
jgi:hypothetical protein